MPYEVNEEYEHTGGFTLVDEGIYLANIFEVTKKQKDDSKAPGGVRRYYEVTCRIDGGIFDGEDMRDTYVGLSGKSLFKIYDITSALDELALYYDAEQKRWHHIPAPEDLEGKQLYIKVDHEQFHASKDGVLQYVAGPNGEQVAKMLTSAKISAYFSAKKDKPEYRPSRQTPAAPSGPVDGAANVMAGGGTPVQEQAVYNGDTPW